MFEVRKIYVKEFIQGLRPTEEHYTKGKTQRQYLDCDMSIKKLWRVYNNSHDVEYNFSDMLTSTTLRYAEDIPDQAAYYSRLTTTTLRYAEDIPDQAANYSRLTSTLRYAEDIPNSLGITIVLQSIIGLKINDTRALKKLHLLCLIHWKLQIFLGMRLCSDGLPGQNKNSTVVGTVLKLFKEECDQKIKTLEFWLSVVGHSFTPPDRVFGRIEKLMRRKQTAVTPKYSDLQNVLRPTWQRHSKISLCKTVVLTRNENGQVRVRGELQYKTDTGTDFPITKRGVTVSNIVAGQLPNKVPIKAVKLKYVDKLSSKHFGEGWRDRDNLTYYKTVIDSQTGVV
ncbi:hypothetical protein PR048_000598 [Dryococelus australis]|uniref:Uncharacterized protein n=1 Tax=Dryococelus australis TaxID=614101 RepID=A0ABQ9IF36_9NEOP|nr:hypothetical protein PR048_000598 [Dryococelus australis]